MKSKIRNPYYDPAFRVRHTFGFWKRIILFFLPTYTAVDSPFATHYKVWRGVVYIVGQERL